MTCRVAEARAVSCAAYNANVSIRNIMLIIAITTSSSTSVKPRPRAVFPIRRVVGARISLILLVRDMADGPIGEIGQVVDFFFVVRAQRPKTAAAKRGRVREHGNTDGSSVRGAVLPVDPGADDLEMKR